MTGTLAGLGLTGTFSIWRDGDRERDEQQLGPDVERTLRLGDRYVLQDANGNVRTLTGPLLRHERTESFIESNAFVYASTGTRSIGTRMRGGRRYDLLEVRAPDGDPETVEIDDRSALPARATYVDNDGETTMTFSDWRNVEGHERPFRTVMSEGDRRYDVTIEVRDVHVGAIPGEIFAPLRGRAIDLAAPQTLPLTFHDGHLLVTVHLDGMPYQFLVDSGAQGIVIDTALARKLNLREEGDLIVSGTARQGGMHLTRLPELTIGEARLRDLVVSTFPLGAPGSIDGILGYPFFASSIVRIDIAHRRMTIAAPGDLAPEGDRLSLIADRQLPEARLRIDGSLEAPFMIDTGNAADLLLYRPFIEAHPGIAHLHSTTRRSYGIGGATASNAATLPALTLGRTTLHDLTADVMIATSGAFADRYDAGNVGVGLLRRFIVTFDFPDGALYLAPAQSTALP